ncbi:hypothetical protein MBLNU457_7430t1 [Dothideomycetes sp. NU457]
MAPPRRAFNFDRHNIGRPFPVLVPEGHFLLRQGDRASIAASLSVPTQAQLLEAEATEHQLLIVRVQATNCQLTTIVRAPVPILETRCELWEGFAANEKRWIVDQAIYNQRRAELNRPPFHKLPVDKRNVDVARLLHHHIWCDEGDDDGLNCLLRMADANELLSSLRDGKARATMSIGPHIGPLPPQLIIPPGVCREIKFWRVGFYISTDHLDAYLTIEINKQWAKPFVCDCEPLRWKKLFKSEAAKEAAREELNDNLDQLDTLLRCMTRDAQSDGLSISQIEMLARAMGNPIPVEFDYEYQ